MASLQNTTTGTFSASTSLTSPALLTNTNDDFAEYTGTVNIPSSYNLQTRASIDWNGPIEELVEKISNAAHYRLRIIGNAPAIPVLINMNVKDQSLAEILRNIDYQAGTRANIYVYPRNQVIELRYAKFYN